MATHALFLLFVAVAVYVQGLTGFALGLILLGLVGLTDLVPLTDAANAVTILLITNAIMILARRRSLMRLDRVLWPAAAASLAGTVVGMWVLSMLANNTHDILRLILGISIIGCAILLMLAVRPLRRPSSPLAFGCMGGLAGLLGGMFSAPGPPLVYLLYRQPWPHERIRDSLIFLFGLGAALRLVVLVATGSLEASAMLLAAEAVPVVLVVSLLSAKYPSPFSPSTVKRLVCFLLMLAGVGIVGSVVLTLHSPT